MEAATPQPDPVAKSSGSGNKTVSMVIGSLLVVVILGLIVFFATRQSDEDKALQAVCTSRADIQARVESLASTTVTNFTLEGFKQNVQGFSNDVSTIRSNQSKLKADRKQEVQAANQAFETSVTTTLKSLGTSLSISNAQEKLKTAGQQLVSSYKETLQPVDCSGVDIDS
jgi:biopolymer transport protein ExbB/TolQ